MASAFDRKKEAPQPAVISEADQRAIAQAQAELSGNMKTKEEEERLAMIRMQRSAMMVGSKMGGVDDSAIMALQMQQE